MTYDGMTIEGLPLPPLLSRMVRSGHWQPPAEETLRAVFGEPPVQPFFYTEQMLYSENQAWHADPEIAGPSLPRTEESLGIQVPRSLVIADMGPSMPVVLDYRESLETPRVIYMRDGSWILITSSFDELAARLHLA